MIRMHFTQLTQDDWSCCFCQRLLRQPGGNVSNLIKHLMNKHHAEYKLMFGKFRVKTEQVEDIDDDETQSSGWILDLLLRLAFCMIEDSNLFVPSSNCAITV